MRDLNGELKRQLEVTRVALLPTSQMHTGLCEMERLISLFMEYIEEKVDEKLD